MDGSSLRTRVEELLGRPLAAPPPVVTDTTQFMNIWRGHVIRLDDRHFLVERDMKEGRFGLDEEPKYCQDVSDSDVRSLGNILVYVIGKGERTFHDLRAGRLHSARELVAGDASAFFVHRIMNLRKLFPWIPRELNEILMHFSYGTRDFYESAEEVLADLRPVADALDPPVRTAGEGGAS